MRTWLIRIIFILFSTTLGGFWGYKQALTLFTVSLGIASVESILKRKAIRVILICLIGLILGLVAASLLSDIGRKVGINQPAFAVAVTLIFSYIGMITVSLNRDELNVTPLLSADACSKQGDFKLLDTSALIDGRIKEICRSGFIEGTILVPSFVLEELHHIADSRDRLRRNIGLRGLKMLKEMQNDTGVNFQIIEEDLSEIDNIDTKIIQLAKAIGAKVITNDFNLNKVAELQAITVLNINELAQSVKPMVVAGELMTVRVLREGKEFNQGVAYLDDGTMVIVKDGRKYIGQTIKVLVRKVLTTDNGMVIFTMVKKQKSKRRSYRKR